MDCPDFNGQQERVTMWKWLILLVVIGGLLGGAAVAQDTPDLTTFVPADSVATLELNLTDAAATLRTLNASYFAAALVQPERVIAQQGGIGWDGFFPLDQWFDVEGVTFSQNVLSWLGDDLLIAYRGFNGGLIANPDNVLLVLSSSDLVSAAAHLSPIIQGQEGMTESTYRGVQVYADDQTAIALTTPAVFIGAPDFVRAALDVQAGAAPALSEQTAFRDIRASLPDALATAYVQGDHLLAATNGLLNGLPDSERLLAAFGESWAQIRPEPSWLSRLLTGAYDAAGAALLWDETTFQTQTQVRLHGAVDVNTPVSFPAELLDAVPRSAFLLHSGANLRTFLWDALAAVPMSNYARELLGGLPIMTAGTADTLNAPPTSSQLQAAISAFLVNLQRYQQVDVQTALLDKLGDPYVLALLPRPNNPLPLLNTPFDLLLLTTSPDAEGAAAGAASLLQAIFTLTAGDVQTAGDWTLTPLLADGETEPIFTLGVNGDQLLLTTGSADSVLNAPAGAITAAEWWSGASPDLYIDLAGFNNTLFPTAGGFTMGETQRSRLLLRAEQAGSMDALTLTVALPSG
jgi:hypothetical protein